MSSNAWLALLLDGPMQSWGHASRFERRTTALHPTRSGVFGLIAAAMGIDKNGAEEAAQLARLQPLRVTSISLARRNRRGGELLMRRLEDYHTVTGIRRASGKEDKEATVQTYRQYLLDARFGVLLEGPAKPLQEIAAALRDPKWGVWLGRKSCVPATPVLAVPPGERLAVWQRMLHLAGFTGAEVLEEFDHVIETAPGAAGSDMIEDVPLGYGHPIGERHAPRWIRRIPRSSPRTLH
jgi:CRISPR system Cascade subunit CasD